MLTGSKANYEIKNKFNLSHNTVPLKVVNIKIEIESAVIYEAGIMAGLASISQAP